MSISMYQRQLDGYRRDQINLRDSLAKENDKLAHVMKVISSLYNDLQKAKTPATLRSKQSDLTRKQEEVAKIQKEISTIERKLADKARQISTTEQSLQKAIAQEAKKQADTQKRQFEELTLAIEDKPDYEAINALSNFGLGGISVNLSDEAKLAAQQLLELLQLGVIGKEQHIIEVSNFEGTSHYIRDNEGNKIDFPIQIADMKELAAYRLMQIHERRNSRGTTGWNILLLPEALKSAIGVRQPLENFTIFYSWQSWSPNNTNRGLIGGALEKATKRLRQDDSGKVYEVERDTQGRAGSVDIAATIFEKIQECQVFVADVTIITSGDALFHSPNPNVMLELGYAAAILGWDQIICVANTVYGGVDKMPFDLRARRILTYYLPEDEIDRASDRNRLSEAIYEAVRAIIERLE